MNLKVSKYLKSGGVCQLGGKPGECLEITVPPILDKATVSIPEFLKLVRLLQENEDKNGHAASDHPLFGERIGNGAERSIQ